MKLTQPDKKLLAAFEARTLDPAKFHHIEHVKIAFLLLRKHGFLETVSRYSEGIKAIAAKAGAHDKFNLTITLGFLSIIAERMEKSDIQNLDNFINLNNDLLKIKALGKHYDSKRLNSEVAKKIFLLP